MKLKMLIVDDELQMLESLRQLFDSEFIVLTAQSGEEALALAQQSPDLAVVISDQRMPTMKGVELLKQIKQMLPDTMRILLTGYTDLDAVLDSVNLGEIFRYVRKPWQPDTLKSIVSLAAASFVLRKQKQTRAMLHPQSPSSAPEPPKPNHTAALELSHALNESLLNPPPPASSSSTAALSQNHHSSDASPSPSVTPPEPTPQKYASFEEEFFATFKPETLAEVKKYESFEEEFFAKLNEHTAMLEARLAEEEKAAAKLASPTSPATENKFWLNDELEEMRAFREVFYGRSGKPKVLVVDDEKRVLTALTDLLSDEFNVIACNDARTALDVLESNALISVLLSDQRMPGMNGVDFLIAAHRIAPLVPKILMTGYTDLEDIVRLVNEGQIFRHIQKPWDVSKLRECLLLAAEEFRRRVEHGLRHRHLYLKTPTGSEPLSPTDSKHKAGRNTENEIASLRKIAALLRRT